LRRQERREKRGRRILPSRRPSAKGGPKQSRGLRAVAVGLPTYWGARGETAKGWGERKRSESGGLDSRMGDKRRVFRNIVPPQPGRNQKNVLVKKARETRKDRYLEKKTKRQMRKKTAETRKGWYSGEEQIYQPEMWEKSSRTGKRKKKRG